MRAAVAWWRVRIGPSAARRVVREGREASRLCLSGADGSQGVGGLLEPDELFHLLKLGRNVLALPLERVDLLAELQDQIPPLLDLPIALSGQLGQFALNVVQLVQTLHSSSSILAIADLARRAAKVAKLVVCEVGPI